MIKTNVNNWWLSFLINSFVWLLLYDSIFRKWLIPSLTGPIMALKQAVAILIIISAIRYVRSFSVWEWAFALVGVIVFCTTLVFGHQNLLVDLWGCYPYWFALPVCYILGKLLTEEDMISIGRLLVYTAIINSVFTCIEFTLPVNSFLNSTGGEINENLIGRSIGEMSGSFRPSGIFMSTTSASMFSIFGYTFMLYFYFIRTDIIKRWILIAGICTTFLGMICAVSRTNVMYIIGMTIYFMLFCADRKTVTNMLKALGVFALIFSALLFTPLANKALNNMGNRFDNASQSTVRGKNVSTLDGTLMDIYNRTVGYNIEAMTNPRTLDGDKVPFWGYGQGMSTQVGGRLLGIKKNSGFALAEWDGLRYICESGLFLGWIIIIIRMGYTLRFIPELFLYRREEKYLSLLLFPCFFLSFFLLNSWGTSSILCFAMFMGGLFFASRDIVD